MHFRPSIRGRSYPAGASGSSDSPRWPRRALCSPPRVMALPPHRSTRTPRSYGDTNRVVTTRRKCSLAIEYVNPDYVIVVCVRRPLLLYAWCSVRLAARHGRSLAADPCRPSIDRRFLRNDRKLAFTEDLCSREARRVALSVWHLRARVGDASSLVQALPRRSRECRDEPSARTPSRSRRAPCVATRRVVANRDRSTVALAMA